MDQPTTLYQDIKRVFSGVKNLLKAIFAIQLMLNVSIAVHFLMWFTPFLFSHAALNGDGCERQFAHELFTPITNLRIAILLLVVGLCYYAEWKLFVKLLCGIRWRLLHEIGRAHV